MECSPNGRNAPRAAVCVTNNIKSYPTWIIGGERYVEIMQPEKLARISRYTGPPAGGNR